MWIVTAIFWREATAFQTPGAVQNVRPARPQSFLRPERTCCT